MKFKKYLILGVLVIFIFSPLSLFAEPQDWGVSGNEITFDASSAGGNFNFNIGGEVTTWTPGTSFTGAISSNSTLNSYIGDNIVQQTDWGQLGLNIGISIATAYVGSIISNSATGAWQGANSGTGAWSGAAQSVANISFQSTINTALITQAVGTGIGQIGAEEGWDDSDTYIASAAAGSLVGFGYGGGYDKLFSNGVESTSNGLATGAGTAITLGAPVLGAYYVTAQVSDEDIAAGEIPIAHQAIGAAIGITGSIMGQALVNPNTFRTPELVEQDGQDYQNLTTGEELDYLPMQNTESNSYDQYVSRGGQTTEGYSYGPVSESRYNSLARTESGPMLNTRGIGNSYDNYVRRGGQTAEGYSYGPVSENYYNSLSVDNSPSDNSSFLNILEYSDTYITGITGASGSGYSLYTLTDSSFIPRWSPNYGTNIYLTYSEGFSASNFTHSVFVEPVVTGIVSGLGTYLQLATTEYVTEELTDSYGEYDWRTQVGAAMTSSVVGGLWQPVTEYAMLNPDFLPTAPSAIRDFAVLKRENAYSGTAIELVKKNIADREADKIGDISDIEQQFQASEAEYLRQVLGFPEDATYEEINQAANYLNQYSQAQTLGKREDLAESFDFSDMSQEMQIMLTDDQQAFDLASKLYGTDGAAKSFDSQLDSLVSSEFNTDDFSPEFVAAMKTAFGGTGEARRKVKSRMDNLASLATSISKSSPHFSFDKKSLKGSITLSSLWGSYDTSVKSHLSTVGYDQFMADNGQSSLNVFTRQAVTTGTSSALQGLASGTFNYLNTKYVKHQWLGLDRHDDQIDALSNQADRITSLANNLDSETKTAVEAALEEGETLSSDYANNQYARAYYNSLQALSESDASYDYASLDDVNNRLKYFKSEKYQLNVNTQGEQLLASLGTNIATSVVRGIGLHLGWNYSGGMSVYEYGVQTRKGVNEDLGIVGELAHNLRIEPTIRYLPSKDQTYVIDGTYKNIESGNKSENLPSKDQTYVIDSISKNLENVSKSENLERISKDVQDFLGEDNLLVQGYEPGERDLTRYYVVSRDSWQNNRNMMPDYINSGGGVVKDYKVLLGDKHNMSVVGEAQVVPMVMDIYERPSFWDSISTSVVQSTYQALESGFSLGNKFTYTGRNYTGADWSSYVGNLSSYIRSAANGFSIPAAALTQSNLNVASNNIMTALATFPQTADLFGYKYLKLAEIVNSTDSEGNASPQWIFMNMEYTSPMLNQRLFLPQDSNLGVRSAAYNAANFSEFINQKTFSSDPIQPAK